MRKNTQLLTICQILSKSLRTSEGCLHSARKTKACERSPDSSHPKHPPSTMTHRKCVHVALHNLVPPPVFQEGGLATKHPWSTQRNSFSFNAKVFSLIFALSSTYLILSGLQHDLVDSLMLMRKALMASKQLGQQRSTKDIKPSQNLSSTNSILLTQPWFFWKTIPPTYSRDQVIVHIHLI